MSVCAPQPCLLVVEQLDKNGTSCNGQQKQSWVTIGGEQGRERRSQKELAVETDTLGMNGAH